MADAEALKERQMRLDRAEREAKGDFSKSDPSEVGTSSAASSTAASSSSSSAAATKLAKENEDDSWKKYKRPEDDDDLTPAAILNKQHSNLRAQAKVDQGIMGLLDVSLPREEGRM